MSSCASLIFLFLFSLLTNFRASAQLYHYCPNMTTYSRNSTYFTNLRTLLSSLSSHNASYSTGFQNATVGQSPDRVTGLFLCRGDSSPEVCRRCVAFSIKNILTRCPNETEAVFYYNECMLRYSDQYTLSTLTFRGDWTLLNGIISSNQNQIYRFVDLVSSTMNQTTVEAANSSRKFYAKKADWTALQTSYVLSQCTPDLRRVDCLRCLQYSINAMPLYRMGGRTHYPSCYSRYELYDFYNETAITTQPPPPLPTLSPTSPASSPI